MSLLFLRRRLTQFSLLSILAILFLGFVAASAFAQTGDSDEDANKPAATETADSDSGEEAEETPALLTDAELSAGGKPAHNAWMLLSCALVLFMTAPGLAMF